MFKYITLHRKDASHSFDVFLANGFTRKEHEDMDIHFRFSSEGIVTSPENSMNHWHKDGRVYLFDGWEEDEQTGLMADNPRFIRALDITDLVKEMGIYA